MKESEGFARDDDTGIALSKHIRCTLRGIDPFPHAVMRGTAKNPSCTPSFLAPFASAFSFSAFSHRAIYTIPSFRAQREIFLALRHSLLLSLKDSPFPLSHIQRYTGIQKRSLHFGRDDGTRIALSKHSRCTLRGIDPFPHTVISSAARNLPRTPRFLASFAEAFPFSVSHIGRYTGVQERSLHFGRDDNEDGALLSLFSCRHAKECLFEAH